MGLLVRLRHDADIAELEVRPVVREALLRPRLSEDVERLEKTGTALAVLDIEPLVVTREPAAADAELKPPLREMVDGRDVLGETQGMTERQNLNRDADLDPARAGGERRSDHERRGQHRAVFLEVNLGEPHGVEPELLGSLHLRQGLVEGDGLVHARRRFELREQTELHALLPAQSSAILHQILRREVARRVSAIARSRRKWRRLMSQRKRASSKRARPKPAQYERDLDRVPANFVP